MSLDPTRAHKPKAARSSGERRSEPSGATKGAERRSSVADRRRENNDHYLTFWLGRELLGLQLAEVQEVLDERPLAPIPLASREVAGYINLRGQIVTALELRARLGMEFRPAGDRWMSLVVRHRHELFSLVVDAVGDVFEVGRDVVRPCPATLESSWRSLCTGVVQLSSGKLMLVLDLPSVFTST